MKNTPTDDPTSKALRERYTRLLGLDQDEVLLEEKKAKEISLIQWCLFLLLLSVIVLGTWFFFNSLMEEIESLQSIPPGTELLQQPSPEPTASQEPVRPAPIEPPDGTAEVSVQPATPEPELPGTNDMSHQPSVSGSFLVVLLSTKSKDKAIERAKSLRDSGYASEVILSSSGYYGVVLRHDTSEQAETSMKAIVASGITKGKPYIMPVGRVKESIYPKAE